jgi:phenylalanyl-tRNA synthetase beta chain
MRLPLRWLAEWIALPSQEELDLRLTLAGIEIKDVLRTGPDLSAIRVGHVLERKQHPNADRLSVCRVDLGQGEPANIVCGAPNVAAGQKVAVAVPGVTLPDGTKLKKSKIRGEVSEGMICSARELGISDEHAGILVLAADARVGAPLPEVLSAGETIFEVEITPNRGDWASLQGVAREVKALFGGTLTPPPCDPPEGEREAAADVKIAIDDRAGCHHYVGRVVRGLTVGPSPDWLAKKLESAGMRAINVVVDVTNLVMLELGQPLHAFDLATLGGGQVRVRAARPGEKLATLDGETRELQTEDLVIADAERAIALAGVMGGAETEVRPETTDVLIEAAHFAAVRVRRSARRLGLRTEASYRFERGVDAEGVARAADRAARLLAELAGGTVSRGRVEARGEPARRPGDIALDPAHPGKLLGATFTAETCVALLARVGIQARLGADQRLHCAAPSWRNDLEIAQDLIEEIARIHGYDALEATMPAAPLSPVTVPAPRPLAERARDELAALGFLEARFFPASFPEELDALRLPEGHELRRALRLANPIQGEGPLLATTLLPGLLRAARRNLSRQVDAVRLFEVARVFRARAPGELPDERLSAAALLTAGERTDPWAAATPVSPFFAAKGAAERLVDALDRRATFRAGSDAPWLHPGASGEIRAGETVLCRLGELHPETAAAFGIAPACAVLELDLAALPGLPVESRRYREVSPYPAVRRDLAVLLERGQPAGEVLEAIRKNAGQGLVSAGIFDRYEGKGIPEGKKSVAFRLVFQRLDRTLQDSEVSQTIDRIVDMLRKRFGAELR